ncbi:MAG: MltA domain-containing protein, partial [Desulfobulbaceae bacterium]|nr:MltA domain-containing protein [Desulfobulbaceae bacterium]
MKIRLCKGCIFLLLAGFFTVLPLQSHAASCPGEPFLALTREQAPFFLDDMDQESLVVAMEASLRYLSRLPEERKFWLCGEEYPVSWLRESLGAFKEIIEKNPDAESLGRTLSEGFTICRAAGRRADNQLLFTGYFEPLFRGSLEKTATYRYPLYRVAGNLVQ